MPDRADDRGVSEVISYALVFTLILVSIVIVSVLGVASLDDARSAEQAQNAKKAFDVLHANMGELSSEGAPSRATEIELGESQLESDDYVNITLARQKPGGSWDNDTYDVRPIVQELEEERRMVYEAGAVFRTNRQSGLVLRAPPLMSRDDSVHFSLLALDSPSPQGVGSGTVVVRAEVTDREVLVSDTDGTYDTFLVNVTSPRAEQWEDYFEDEGFSCSGPSDGSVECERGSFDRLYVTVHEVDLTLIR